MKGKKISEKRKSFTDSGNQSRKPIDHNVLVSSNLGAMGYIGTAQALWIGMKNKLSVALLALGFTTLTITAASAHSGPHPYHHGGWYGPGFFPSVGFVINARETDDSQDVSLVGHVFSKTGDSTYLFTDGNNTFRLNSANSDLPMGSTIAIRGQFDDGLVDVRKWHYAE